MTTRHPILLRSTALRLAGAMMVAAVLAAGTPAPVLAQDAAAETRLRKIEAEIRALQRKVFPGGDGRFFEPQIAPGTEAAANPAAASVAAPSTTAVTDILVRLDALEAQLRTLTARSEEQANALGQLEMRLAALETRSGAGLALPAASGPLPGTAAPAPAAAPPAIAAAAPAAATPTSATRPATTAPATTPPLSAPSPERLAAVQAIAKPQTDDRGDDEYSYGFRLWSARLYPEARQQLTRFVEQFPTHPRISFGRNLLGRAFLDDNMPKEAAQWFLKNYQADRNGDRAADSLLYLAQSMVAMKDTKRACIALAEFGETYPAIATGRLASEYQATRSRVTCS